MNRERQKELRRIAAQHYFTRGQYDWQYQDWIDGKLDGCDRCMSEANIDKDVVDLYELLVNVTEPDHEVADAARAYVDTMTTSTHLEGTVGPCYACIARDASLKALVAVVKGKS